jgi:hypothetical protein
MRLLVYLGLAVCSMWAQDRSVRWSEDLDALERELSTRGTRACARASFVRILPAASPKSA